MARKRHTTEQIIGKPVGIFGACHHLKRAGKQMPEEAQLFEKIDA